MREGAGSLLETFEVFAQEVVNFLPRAGLALAILLTGWLVAKTLRALSRTVMGRLGRRFLKSSADAGAVIEKQGMKAAGAVVFWGVIFLAGMFATEALGLPVITAWLGSVTSFLPRAALAVGIVLASLVAARLFQGLALRAAESIGARGAERIGGAVRWIFLLLGGLVAMQQLGIDVSFVTTTFFIVLGAAMGGAALAFGLGGRNVVANIMAMHYLRRTYRPGDEVQFQGFTGRVVRTTPTGLVLEGPAGEINIPGDALLGGVVMRKANPT